MRMTDKISSAINKRMNKILFRDNKVLKLNKPVISFTFDDVPKTAVTNGVKILNYYNKKGTFYISLSLLGGYSDVGLPILDLDDLEKLISNGHEIGDHTFSHLKAFDVTDEEYKNSIIINQERMEILFPGYKFTSFAYPFGALTPFKKKIVKRFYKVARGIEEGYNNTIFDSMLLKSFHLAGDKNKFEFYKRIIDKSVEHPSWLIFFTHEVQSNPTEFGCDQHLFELILNYCIKNEITIKSIYEFYREFYCE